MSAYIDWEFSGKNNDGTYLTEKQIETLISLDEFDFNALTFENNDKLFCYGYTTSVGAYERIENTVKQFVFLYPEVKLFITACYECDKTPYVITATKGKVRTGIGKFSYFYCDNNEAIDLNNF